MDGVTDLPARLWLSLASLPDFAITPFFRVTQGYPLQKLPATYCPEALQQETPKALSENPRNRGTADCRVRAKGTQGSPADAELEGFRIGTQQTLFNRAVRPQLMGNCPHELARFSRFLLERHDSVDLNFGCPAPKVVGHNGGSGLIKCTQNLRKFLNSYFDNVPPGRTSIKTRLGFECKSEAAAILQVFEEFPLSELTLHGRTRAQKYTGKSDWQLIAKLADTVRFPVTVSGDICSFEDLGALLSIFPNVQSVLVGRGALRNPWLFQELRTQKHVALEWGSLSKSLKVFFLISELCQRERHEELIKMLRRLEKARPSANSSQVKYWQTIEEGLLSLFAELHEHAANSKSSLSRLKMLWNFLKTSLPAPFMNATLMRCNEVAEFFAFLEKIVQIESESFEFLVLKHNTKHNWIFSGERNTNDPP